MTALDCWYVLALVLILNYVFLYQIKIIYF